MYLTRQLTRTEVDPFFTKGDMYRKQRNFTYSIEIVMYWIGPMLYNIDMSRHDVQ